MRVNDLVKFIKEREKVRVNKEAGKPRPWTTDGILAKYRFCNVHREDDRVTRWLRENWYTKFGGDPDIWFAAVVARLLNYPDSLTDVIEYTLPFRPTAFRAMLHGRKVQGLKNFNAAYIVSTNGVAMDKVDYLVERVLGPLWAARKELRPSKDDELEDYHTDLIQYDGLGSFIAAQVVADLKYMEPLKNAPDWYTFAASGPGSRRGLNRVARPTQPVDASWIEGVWREALKELLDKVNKKLSEPLHAQDLQNCLCEFDKYERARLGEGTPKQIYKERAND
jgi:hypothetical protein